MTAQQIFLLVINVLVGFFCGSIMFCALIPRLWKKVDIREISADGNPGTANVFKYCGWQCGLVSACCDFAKGCFPVIAGNILLGDDIGAPFALIIAAPVLGHMFSIFSHGNGGMGIASLIGTIIAVFFASRLLLIIAGIYLITQFLLKFPTRKQKTTFVFLLFLLAVLLLEPDPLYKWTYTVMTCLVLFQIFRASLRVKLRAGLRLEPDRD